MSWWIKWNSWYNIFLLYFLAWTFVTEHLNKLIVSCGLTWLWCHCFFLYIYYCIKFYKETIVYKYLIISKIIKNRHFFDGISFKHFPQNYFSIKIMYSQKNDLLCHFTLCYFIIFIKIKFITNFFNISFFYSIIENRRTKKMQNSII